MKVAAETQPLLEPALRPRYWPMRDYALIGDCHGAALVARDGAIDWACLGRFDAAPAFSRLLDARQGGFFELRPAVPMRTERRYLGETAILVTRFLSETGEARLIDFMPLGRRPDAGAHDYTRVNAPGWIIRALHGVAGRVPFRAAFRATHGFPPAHGAAPHVAPTLQATVPLADEDGTRTASFEVAAGESACFIVGASPLATDLRAIAERMLGVTRAFWEEWIGYCRDDVPYAAALRRSAIVLKLMSYAPTGAIVAAPTTSIPEEIGGTRNWDYRFSWIRDASFALYALAGIGYAAEARDFVGFLRRQHLQRQGLRLMYGIAGETELSEHVIEGFEGYRASAPVRVGNAAHRQLQTDIYGELLEFAALYDALGGRFDRRERAELAYVADLAATNWRKPDHGIWEVRTRPRHFVHSKIMCWVALDRAMKLLGPRPAWRRAAAEIVEAVHREGRDPNSGHLVQAFGREGCDAALLAAAWAGFPLAPGVLERTVDAIVGELGEGDYLRRYRTPDGVGGLEGAFVMSGFWLVSALLCLGRAEAAEARLATLLSRANDVGLFAEEIDPKTHDFIGNFPQAFVHIAVVMAVLRLAAYRRGGEAELAGSPARTARRHAHSIGGIGHLWALLRQSLRVGRAGGSRRSVLPLP